MKHLLYILIILFLASCNNNTKTKKVSNIDLLEKAKTEAFIYNVYNSDSVKIDIKNDNFKFTVYLAIGNFKKEYNLTELNIPTKTPDEIEWRNNEYACMMTWWSQEQSRHIFIPTRSTNKLIYLNKDIAKTDSINNNVVYIDSVFCSDKVLFKIENLLTRKSKSITILINNDNEIYPYSENIILRKNNLTITTSREKKRINIKSIYNIL